MRRRCGAPAALLGALVLLSGCSVEGSTGVGFLLEITRAEHLWDRQNLADYDYRYMRGCFCIPDGEILVKVRQGEVVSATRLSDGVDLTGKALEAIPTIDELFGITREAIANAHETVVEFHPTLGHPTSIAIDWVERIADDEVFYTIDALAPVGSPDDGRQPHLSR